MSTVSIDRYPVGAHVIIRDAEWRVVSSDPVNGGYLLKCTGVSDFVRGTEGLFFTLYERDIVLLKPEDTELIQDMSPGFISSRLYLEAVLRTAPKTDPQRLYVGHKGVMDCLPYQFDPVMQALSQTRPRILIADAVGIGKTLEAAILTAELMARGRARRILVITTKAMLLQFQQDFWNRFAIPLHRLDSSGIRREINRIPSGQNPFLFFERVIVSVDTLKQREYLGYLEQAAWDLIIIDEAHNVAFRGEGSQRARLARILSRQSDSMIMLTATPHDGSARSFASLMNVLDPTAIPDPEHYTADDIADKGLLIRRFKADIRNQAGSFAKRRILSPEITASAAENAVFERIERFFFDEVHSRSRALRRGEHLFSSIMTKAVFSSPRACAKVIEHRLTKLKKGSAAAGMTGEDRVQQIQALTDLLAAVNRIDDSQFSKLSYLCSLLEKGSEFGWNRADPDDRLVIFTESIPTLEYLGEVLPVRLNLRAEQVMIISGQMPEDDICREVNEFNKAASPVRVLLCSDVASEGINLHHRSHRLIHFDLPWSLMTFQQRNGRIDRYGQTREPVIVYLQTIAANDKARDDAYILRRLQEKDEQAQTNIDDPSEFVKSREEQEDETFRLIEGQKPQETKTLTLDEILAASASAGDSDRVRHTFARVMTRDEYMEHLAPETGLFSSDLEFAAAVLKYRQQIGESGQNRDAGGFFELQEDGRTLCLELNAQMRLRMPPEVLPAKGGRLYLTEDRRLMQREIDEVRASDADWPAKQLLYPLHPVIEYLTDWALSGIGHSRWQQRREAGADPADDKVPGQRCPVAPVLNLQDLTADEVCVLLDGGYPNRRGYTPVYALKAVYFKGPAHRPDECRLMDTEELLPKVRVWTGRGNTGVSVDTEALREYIPQAIELLAQDLRQKKAGFETRHQADLKLRLEKLQKLRQRHENLLSQIYEVTRQDRELLLNQKQLEIAQMFDGLWEYMRNISELEPSPYIRLVAVFTGS